MIKQFVIFKNDKATGNQPQYDMLGKDEQGNKFRLASIWLKDHNGKKYYSGQMKDEYTNSEGKTYDGFVIISQAEYKKLTTKPQGNPERPNDDENPDGIPF